MPLISNKIMSWVLLNEKYFSFQANFYNIKLQVKENTKI